MHWRNRIVFGVIAALIILAISYGFRSDPLYVDMAEVKRAPLRVIVEEEGKTRVVDRFVISAPIAGYVKRITLDVGAHITKGQPVFQLEPLRSGVLDPRSRAAASARVEAARDLLSAAHEKVVAATASADLAATKLKRIQELRKSNYVTQNDLDSALAENRRSDAEKRSAKFSVEVARHEMEAAKTALQYSAAQKAGDLTDLVDISSPVEGRVLKVHHKSEGVVAAGEALLEVGNPRTLEVEVDVLSNDAVRIKPGTHVIFNRWGGEYILKGEVRVVEPVGFTKISALGVEEQRVLVIVDIVSPPDLWQRLGDGYRVEAGFILWEKEDVLQVPASALFHYKDGWAVFVIENGRAQRRIVKTGQRNGLATQILEGLKQGEQVISHPDDAIDNDTRVKIR